MFTLRATALLCLSLLILPQSAIGATAAAANLEGTAHFNAGRIAEAVAKFREVLASEPSFTPAARNLAVALGQLGQQALLAERLDEARVLLEEAADLHPAEPHLPYLLAVIALRRGDLYEARRRVDLALDEAPDLVPARVLSGDIFYQDGFLSRAQREWEDALEVASPAEQHQLRMRIDRVMRESDAERGFGSEVSSHFTIHYEGTVPRDLARAALKNLEESYDLLWREFGRAPRSDLPVILSSRAIFDEVTGSPAVVSGTYDGKIRIPVGGLRTAADAERLRPILAHELTHAFIRAITPTRLPLWFEEGLAEHFEGMKADNARKILSRHGTAPFPSLAEVNAALSLNPGGGGVDGRFVAAYAAAFLAIDELVGRDGFWLPRRILETVADGRPFEEAFREQTGGDLTEFEERWRKRQQ